MARRQRLARPPPGRRRPPAGQNVGSTGVRFDGSPKADQKSRRLRAEVDPLRRVVSADDILSRARVALAAEAIAEEPALPSSTTVSDDGTMDLADAEAAAAAAETATPAALAASLDVLEERSLLGPVEMGRCRELAAADDAFVRRGLLDALANALDKDQWAELGALVDIHRRARPYDLRDDLRRAVAVAKKEAVGHRVEGRTDEALEAMRELKKLEWQLQHVVDFFDSHRGAVLRG
mmetsp:Transcript_33892/g.104040  ORF Transcript_33892/g.104040 Transcript_33892/m.104040 type:complete len:236 (-) Transcript_33892:164-871(-)